MRPKVEVRVNYAKIWGKSIPREREKKSKCKGPEWDSLGLRKTLGN